MSSGDLLETFYPAANEPPTTVYATADTRNSHPILDFDDTLGEAAIWTGVLFNYAGGGVTLYLAYSMTSATTGSVNWTAEFERIGDQVLDIDADSFGAVNAFASATVPGTSGFVDMITLAIADTGTNLDGTLTGEQFRLRIKRTSVGGASGDAELHLVAVKET